MRNFHRAPNLFIGEVRINVVDLKEAISFYTTIIGLQVLKQVDRQAVLTADGETALVTLEQPRDAAVKERGTSGLYHFALLLPERADLSVFLRHLLETGYPFGAADHYVSEALYLSDPDGNGIEVYRDRPSSEWRWKDNKVIMATEQLDGNSLLAESEEEWTGLPAGTLMGHIHLHVADLAKAEEFYVKGLGFNIVSYYPQAIFASTGGYHHHIALNTWQGTGVPAPKKNSAGLHSFELVFPNEEARETAAVQLSEIGALVTKKEDFYVTADPSGNSIHLIVK